VPRNDIAAIIGLIVVAFYLFAGPMRGRGLPRTPRDLGALLLVFVVAFAIVWIALRLINY
jgi:hypothetical protein